MLSDSETVIVLDFELEGVVEADSVAITDCVPDSEALAVGFSLADTEEDADLVKLVVSDVVEEAVIEVDPDIDCVFVVG